MGRRRKEGEGGKGGGILARQDQSGKINKEVERMVAVTGSFVVGLLLRRTRYPSPAASRVQTGKKRRKGEGEGREKRGRRKSQVREKKNRAEANWAKAARFWFELVA